MTAVRPRRALAAALVSALLGAGGLAPSVGAPDSGHRLERGGRSLVLGSPSYASYSVGFGRAHPRTISNGGAPSGSAQDLVWRNWRGERSVGVGTTPLYRPGGGYYAKRGKIVFRAQRLATCPDGTYGYTRLYFRSASRPGGPVSKTWRPWGNEAGNICDYYAGSEY